MICTVQDHTSKGGQRGEEVHDFDSSILWPAKSVVELVRTFLISESVSSYELLIFVDHIQSEICG